MAVRKPAPEAADPQPGRDHEDLAPAVMALVRMTARLAVAQRLGQNAADFRKIAVTELKIARSQDIDAIEAFIAAHPDL